MISLFRLQFCVFTYALCTGLAWLSKNICWLVWYLYQLILGFWTYQQKFCMLQDAYDNKSDEETVSNTAQVIMISFWVSFTCLVNLSS